MESRAPLNRLSPGLVAQLMNQSRQPRSQLQSNAGSSISVQVLSKSGPVTVTTPSQAQGTSSSRYTYKVKIINPMKKTDSVIRYLNNFTSTFMSVTALRVQLMEEFKDQVPISADFNVGYFETSQQSKVWLVTLDDIKVMYKKFPIGCAITLWCDGAFELEPPVKKKRRDGSGKRQEQEEDVESFYKTLTSKHKELYTTPQYRLWARMHAAGIHDSMEDPPDIPAFSSNPPKRKRKDSLTESLTGAAIAFANTFRNSSEGTLDTTVVGISPRKTVELRMKNYEQLRYLQQLFEDKILCESEYREQKESILKALRNL